MTLIANRHRNVALIVTQGPKFIHILRISAFGIEADKLTEDQLISDWGEVSHYPVGAAVARFRQMAREKGCTETASRLLDKASAQL